MLYIVHILASLGSKELFYAPEVLVRNRIPTLRQLSQHLRILYLMLEYAACTESVQQASRCRNRQKGIYHVFVEQESVPFLRENRETPYYALPEDGIAHDQLSPTDHCEEDDIIQPWQKFEKYSANPNTALTQRVEMARFALRHIV